MLGLSWSELLVIGIVALIVIGPKDLPIMMRRIGEFVGQVRRMGGEFQRELQRAAAIDELKDIKKSVTEPLRQANAEITSQFNKMTPIGMQPTGVLAPRDPKTESVVDAIKTQAGMGAPAVAAPPSTAVDAATATPAAVAKATQVSEPAMTNPAFALSPARKVTPPPAPVAVSEPDAAPTEVAAKPKRVRKPKAAASEVEPVVAADAPAKPKRVRKPAAKVEALAEAAPEASKAARKPRARKAG